MQNQQNIIHSTYTDGFGILPWNFEPGFWQKLFGYSAFTIEADFLLYEHEKKEEKLDYSDITSIESANNKILIKASNDRQITIKAGKASETITNLLLLLSHETNEFRSFMKVDGVMPELGFAYFKKVFANRANPYVRAADVLLKTAIDNGFSDIHFEPDTEEQVRISYRNKGKLKQIVRIPLDHYSHLIARLKFMAGCHSHIENEVQEGAFHSGNTDVRLSVFPTDLGERVSMRFIGAIAFKTVKELGWPEGIAESWINTVKQDRGLYLITGPVGSGKTTTMYATLSELVHETDGQLRAVTIEDPVEAFIDGICQSSLDIKTEKSLGSAFKHLLRQDPDVIALGEIRDTECVVEALQAGLSGHLVFATFHAGSADEALQRIKIMAAANVSVLSGLKGILSLRLEYNGKSPVPLPSIDIVRGA